LRPDGTVLVSRSFGTAGVFVDRTQLPVSGTYTILVDPSGSAVGSVTATLYLVPPDAAAAIVPGGAAVSVAATVPGQNARLTFAGSAGESVTLQLAAVTFPLGTVSLLRPDGTVLVSRSFGSAGVFVDRTQLPVAGAYTILVDPSGAAVGSVSVTLADVPPDVTGTIVPGGAPVTVTLTAPGQNARLTFVALAGRRVTLTLTGSTISSGTMSLLTPTGATLATRFFATSATSLVATLPADGTYTILVDPTAAAVGSATVALT
jgi:hypothetical protein